MSRWSLLTSLPPPSHGPRSAGVRAEGPRLLWVAAGWASLRSGPGVSQICTNPREEKHEEKAISALLGPPQDGSRYTYRRPTRPLPFGFSPRPNIMGPGAPRTGHPPSHGAPRSGRGGVVLSKKQAGGGRGGEGLSKP